MKLTDVGLPDFTNSIISMRVGCQLDNMWVVGDLLLHDNTHCRMDVKKDMLPEYSKALSQMKNNSSPGCDGIIN